MSQRSALPRDAATALRRFGLGPKPGDVARIQADPRGFVLASLADPKAALIAETPPLRSTLATFTEIDDIRIEQAVLKFFGGTAAKIPKALPSPPQAALTPAEQQAAAAAAVRAATGARPGEVMTGTNVPIAEAADAKVAANKANLLGKARTEMIREEIYARFTRGIATDTPLLERLVYFWANHFCISGVKAEVRPLTGPFEREAIRPHILGRFADMLAAVEHHPAMLIYLDNILSAGPNSFIGVGRERGINENLAREILELHTLGVDGGYSQADVTSFARILTGWTYGAGEMVTAADYGRFIFTPQRHEPGSFDLMGKRYGQPGVLSGEAVLADLARHPSTARNIARKLARHFVADNPPKALTARVEKAFIDSDGDLGVVTRTLVESPEAWDAPAAKIVPPFDFLVSLERGFAPKIPHPELLNVCGILGQPVWQTPSPKGWPDADDSWMGPSPIRERLRIAEKVSRDTKNPADPRILLADLGGPGVSETTTLAIQRAETRQQAIELMIMSPEFMRR